MSLISATTWPPLPTTLVAKPFRQDLFWPPCTCLVDNGGQFAVGVSDTGRQKLQRILLFGTCHWTCGKTLSISANCYPIMSNKVWWIRLLKHWRIGNVANGIINRERWFMKKTWSKRSREPIPLNMQFRKLVSVCHPYIWLCGTPDIYTDVEGVGRHISGSICLG